MPDDYQPTWDDVQNKPNPPAMRGSIGPAIPALRVPLIDIQSIPNGARTKVTQWGGGYDQFAMRSGGDFTIPAWASYARPTCSRSEERRVGKVRCKNGARKTSVTEE